MKHSILYYNATKMKKDHDAYAIHFFHEEFQIKSKAKLLLAYKAMGHLFNLICTMKTYCSRIILDLVAC